MEISSTQKKIIAAVGGLTLGFVGGFAIGRYRARQEFIKNLDEEVHNILEEERLNQERALLRKDEFPNPQALIRPQAEEGATPIFDTMVNEYGGHTLDELRQVVEEVEKPDLASLQEHFNNGAIEPRNPQVPATPDDEGLSELDRSTRTLDHPFVISIDEYHEDDEPQEKVTVTYYVGGEEPTLVSEDKSVIDNVDYTVGEDNLQKFGMASSDPNIVYVRNLQNGIDYEVIRSRRSYLEAEFGVSEVSQDAPMRSMREGDGD